MVSTYFSLRYLEQVPRHFPGGEVTANNITDSVWTHVHVYAHNFAEDFSIGIAYSSPARDTITQDNSSASDGHSYEEIGGSSLHKLCIGTADDDYLPRDWEIDGDMIGEHQYLETFTLCFLSDAFGDFRLLSSYCTPYQFEKFLVGVAKNRSIKQLDIGAGFVLSGEGCSPFLPLYLRNISTLRKLL